MRIAGIYAPYALAFRPQVVARGAQLLQQLLDLPDGGRSESDDVVMRFRGI